MHLGPHCTLSALQELVIGDDCLIAERVSIRDHDHQFADPDVPVREQGMVVAPVAIGLMSERYGMGGSISATSGIYLMVALLMTLGIWRYMGGRREEGSTPMASAGLP